VETHTCARVLHNSYANSICVYNIVVKIKKGSQQKKVKVNKLLAELRSKYSVGIPREKHGKLRLFLKRLLKEVQPGNMLCCGDMLQSYKRPMLKI